MVERRRPATGPLGLVGSVSYTHLRAHETDTSLFVGSVQMCIRDSMTRMMQVPEAVSEIDSSLHGRAAKAGHRAIGPCGLAPGTKSPAGRTVARYRAVSRGAQSEVEAIC